MLRTSLAFGAALLTSLALSAPALAQFAPACESANGYSLSSAEQLINQGDAIIVQAPDCSQVNLMLCQDAEALYQQAAQHLAQVFFDAKGDACTYCDIGRLGSLARVLAERERYFSQNLAWSVDLSGIWRDWQNWRNVAICQAVGNPPVAPVAPGAAGAPGLCNSPGGYPNSQLDTGIAYPVPNIRYTDECEAACDAEPACLGFTFDANTPQCLLHSERMADKGLAWAPDGVAYYECSGR